ncbi:hypothetical protein ABZ312_34845 [Streptomyces sp. NPDC006207]
MAQTSAERVAELHRQAAADYGTPAERAARHAGRETQQELEEEP